ncbi:hypothetical protein FOVG_19688 [Fusarium oxysporum f. sp. pisi HDV247]|uniref:DUF7703 domain-containing protein n=1 Tax=Fusarium oxysporum f. sp. pisi HDV247 TaxID=1080344 RepID=W9NFH0_FUSOX|nr:hypothetical protein FOVG_19688 [Fusarium oxysporum f. sp. pisi HDV247]
MVGETGPITASLAINMTIAGFFAVACYNCVEILISLLDRFKRRDGLYFWSMLTATLGIVLHSIVVLLRYYSLGPNFPLAVLTCVGWYAMVTGQSVVLYSRLHLIIANRAKARWILVMIVTNFCILHIPVTVLFLGSNTQNSDRFLPAFEIYERIQLAGFSIQESVISGLYIWEAAHGLQPIYAIRRATERKPSSYSISGPLPDPNDIQAGGLQHQAEDGIRCAQQAAAPRSAQGVQLYAGCRRA